MQFTDLIIIYLACGSPFGVYQITRHQLTRNGYDWINVISSFLFWPIYSTLLIAGFINSKSERMEIERLRSLNDIRLKIEKSVFSDSPISTLFEFREIFSRFVGLSEAARVPQNIMYSSEIFEVTSHMNSLLASRCLARKNQKRLGRHLDQARDQFSGLVARVMKSDAKIIDTNGLISELADQLEDKSVVNAFAELAKNGSNFDASWVDGFEKESCISAVRSTSTVN